MQRNLRNRNLRQPIKLSQLPYVIGKQPEISREGPVNPHLDNTHPLTWPVLRNFLVYHQS